MNHPTGDRIGLMHTWWRGDPLPHLPPLPGLVITPTDDVPLLATLTGHDQQDLRHRIEHGHRPWLARLAGKPIASGWIGTTQAHIPHLGLTLTFRPGDRYLWDFNTLPPCRGQGIYPRLLQAIACHDASADRLWIGHDHPNVASQHGIAKAGFQHIAILYRLSDHRYEFVPSGPIDRATAAAALLGVPLAQG